MDIQHIGVRVGEFESWTLTRRGDEEPDASLYDFRAVFRTVSRALFDDPQYAEWRQVVVVISTEKQYGLEQAAGMRTVLSGMSLTMEGVKLCLLPE